MARGGWGLGSRGRRPFGRRPDPEITPGARELSEWLELTSQDVLDNGRNPYLPAGTSPRWREEDLEPVPAATTKRKRRRAARSAGTAGQSGVPRPSGAPRPSNARRRADSAGTPAPKATTRHRASGWLVLAAPVVIGVGVVLLAQANDGGPGDLGGPEIPNASTTRADLVQLTPTWSAFPDGAMYTPIQGGNYQGVPFVVTPETLVLRLGEDRFDDVDARSLMALRREDGNIAWELALERVICASDLLPRDAGPDLLACAGYRPADAAAADSPGGSRLLFLDPATGEIVVDAPGGGTAASVATAAGGVVVRDVAIRDADREITLRWFDPDGTQLWELNAVDVNPDLDSHFDYGTDEDAISRTDWGRVGEAILVSLSDDVLVLEASGAQAPQDERDGVVACWAVAVTGEDSFVCDGLSATGVARAPGGEWREEWHSRDVDLVGAVFVAPLLLGVDAEQDVATVVSMSADGEVGAEIARLEGYIVRVLGTADVPLLSGREALVALSPGGASGLWRIRADRNYGDGGIFVTGDRVLVPDYSGDRIEDVVRDAADGHEIVRLQQGTLHPVEGRTVLAMSYRSVDLLELP